MQKKNSILIFEIISTIFVMVLGTLLHFKYKWSNNNMLVGIFSPINESIWEHLKLMFFPMLITIIIGYLYKGKDIDNYLSSKVIGTIVMLSFTIVFYYTYSGILGTNYTGVDVSIFFIAVALGQYVSYKLMKTKFHGNNIIAIITLLALLLCFVVFTFFPPNIALFKDLSWFLNYEFVLILGTGVKGIFNNIKKW